MFERTNMNKEENKSIGNTVNWDYTIGSIAKTDIDSTWTWTSSDDFAFCFPTKISIPKKTTHKPLKYELEEVSNGKENKKDNDIWEKIREYNVYVVGSTALAKFFPFIKPKDFDVVVEGITTEELLTKIQPCSEEPLPYTYLGGLKIEDSKICNDGMDIWGMPKIEDYIKKVGFNFLEVAVNLKTQIVVSSKSFNNFLLNKEMSFDATKITKYSKDKMAKRIKLFEDNGFFCDRALSNWVNSK